MLQTVQRRALVSMMHNHPAVHNSVKRHNAAECAMMDSRYYHTSMMHHHPATHDTEKAYPALPRYNVLASAFLQVEQNGTADRQ